ncbi:uncharacterized protein LOC112045535 isoform X2 [Bicyclus anynana]|uniref:Uncharacterized protein LOC112045535 isoform X2 n=1 Tax=Bicyclus anynana TaxID=110368 RepID=A0A6J1MXD6_BICAN|nr:uncharacterized protein LOC112045535 isoform X2 [Bicyclus anynana]
MNTGEAEPSSGLNGRLRPRKCNKPSPKTVNTTRKTDPKPALDKPRRISTPSKAPPTKPDDLTDKADSNAARALCPYCDKTFFTEQALSRHVHRLHLPNSKQDSTITCLFCTHTEIDAHEIVRHMVDNHPNQYFACYDCHTRFPATTDLAEHKLTVCEKQKLPYRNRLRQKVTPKKNNGRNDFGNDVKDFPDDHGFNGIVISCELKSSHAHELVDIEDNITTNFILPPGRNIVNGTVIEKNAVIVLDDLQWNKRAPSNFAFQSTDADQILSRLGVVHRSPRTGESQGREWLRNIEEFHQKFEKCFDTSFYSKVASNVQENLSKFLDGSCNFNPDPENTIKTRKAKNIVAINTVEGFPILLACEQFSRNGFDGYMPRAIAPKHKWKWDNLENDKNIMSPERIKRDSHTNNCIISLVSSLDIWTQLCMRRKFESIFNKSPVQKKTERKSIIGKELKEILESRELPASTAQIVKYTHPPVQSGSSAELPESLGLVPTAPSFDLKPAVLSGEWVRPRCYVCCACGAQTRDSKALSSHISMRHPNAQIQHYEIVGEVLLNSDILKHLYVPPSQINNRTRPPRGFRDCTKCKKSVTLEDLHQHMLDCAGDAPTVRRKCRYRPFGVRKRRPRLPDNMIRKKIRKDLRTRHVRKTHMRPRPRRRTEVGDAETIRKMLADLPAKRHRVVVKPVNSSMRPRRNLQNPRNKIIMKKRIIEETKKPQEPNSSQGCTSSKSVENSNKNSHDASRHSSVRPFKTTVKRVASKILRKQDSFNKNILNKSRKKISIPINKNVNVTSAAEMPSPDNLKDGIQVEQLSNENNSDRINLNDGSNNSREHGSRSNNNSNNRDSQSPDGQNDQGNNSRDLFAPPQNVPLKHSIASLTASSETHDKAVQFHQLFLIQQECNNVNQHVPAEQRRLFENEAAVTKLDKPPLQYSQRRPSHNVDLQALQASKNKQNNKPRKGLNDCIAMLKNKLVEPNSSPIAGFVSVSCGDDEPLEPEPIIVARRHSTNELNTDYAQIPDYVHTPTPKKSETVEDNVPKTRTRASNKSKTTRRSGSTRYGHSSRSNRAAEITPNDNMLTWQQFYYDTQMLATQNITENYNKRESRRRNSLVSADELMLQHAMNLELLAKSTELTKLAEYHHYPSLSTHYHLPKRSNRKDSQKQKATTTSQSTRSKTKSNSTTRKKNVAESSSTITKQSNRNKSNTNTASTKRNYEKRQRKSSQLNNTVTAVEKSIDFYPQGDAIGDTSASLNIGNRITAMNKPTQEHHLQNLPHNTPVVEYTTNSDLSAVQYIISNVVEADISGPLDLTNKLLTKDNSVRYTQEQYPVAAYDTYETLDLSNRNVDNLAAGNTASSDEIVDLRVNFASRDSFQPRYAPIPTDLVNNEIEEDNATDLSIRRDNDFPTDLSVTRINYSAPSACFENLTEDHSRLPLKYIRDLPHLTRHADVRCCIMQEYYDPNSGRIIVVEKEITADDREMLPGTRSVSRLNMCTMEEPVRLDIYTNNTESNDEYVPTDLSGTSGPYMVSTSAVNNNICHYNNFDNQQAPHCINTDQVIDYHYDRPRRAPSETNFIRSSNQTTVACCEPREHYLSNTALPPVSRDLSLNESPVNESANYQQIDYSHSDIPLSLVSNSVVENISYSSSSELNAKANDYELTNTDYECTSKLNNGNSKNEPSYTSTTINTLSVKKNIESLTVTDDNEIQSTKNTDTMNTLSSSDDKASVTLPVSTTIPTTTSTVEKENSKNTNPDQDHDIARKIALLPKELVEILGTMPADHRNQLLNVLPQYVSTSTSPALLSNTDESVKCISESSSLLTSANTTDPVENELKFEANSEDGRMSDALCSSFKNSKFSESSTVSVSSSILLTPPTPQMSERYSLQENTDIHLYMRKSRVSSEEKTPSNSVDISTLNDSANTLTVKHTSKYNDPHKIIDLTIDENSSGNADVTNFKTILNTHVLEDVAATAIISKPLVQKASNDKTASLRAVRIKTPSERHRSMLSENKLDKKHNKTHSINIQDNPIKDSDNISPKAIQQAEISSTQHRPVLKTASCTSNEIPIGENISEDKIIAKKDDDKATGLLDKSNLVTSTLSKETNSSINNDCSAYDITNISAETENISSSKNHSSDLHINDKIDNIQDVTKENVLVEKQSQLEFSKITPIIEEDDSEDDISLAVIVKQKLKNLNSDLNHIIKNDVQNNQKKKRSKKNKKLTFDDKSEFNKSTSTEIICETSLNNNDRESNESSSIDKIVSGKKRAKKGRRFNSVQTVKLAENNGQNTELKDNQNEINKENNVSSDIDKNIESSEDSTKLKSIDQDPNQSSHVDTTYSSESNNKDCPNPLLKNDNDNKNIELNQNCDHLIKIISATNIDERQLDAKCNLSQDCLNSSCLKQSLSQPHANTKHEIRIDSAELPKNTKEIIKCKTNSFNLDDMSEPGKSKEKLVKTKKVTIQISPQANENHITNTDHINTTSELEESCITPLRRSRRGKSLFIDSNVSIAVNPVLRDTEQRTPLTKKQLIFSKLLLDEAKHNKISLNITPLVVDDNLKTTTFNSGQNINEDLNNTSMKIIPNKVEEDNSIMPANNVPHICEQNKTPNILNPNPVSVDQNPDDVSLSSTQAVIEEIPCKTSLQAITHTLEKTLDKSSLNTVSNIAEDNLQEFLPTTKQEIETQTKTSSVRNISIIHKEAVEKFPTSKRKASPQTKSKTKKKKSTVNQATSEDNNESTHQINTNNKIMESDNAIQVALSVENTVPEILSINEAQLVKQDSSGSNIDDVSMTHIHLDSMNTSPKPLSIEKRKSRSPPRKDLPNNSNPKKCRLNDENKNTSIIAASFDKEIERSKIFDDKETDKSRTSDHRVIEKPKISDDKEIERSKLSDNKEIEKSKISDDKEIEKSRSKLSDDKEIETSKISDDKEIEKSRSKLSDDKENGKSRSKLYDDKEIEKSKTSDDREIEKSQTIDHKEIEGLKASDDKEVETLKTNEVKTFPRNITCYNKPARRARSKSVVVKSSNAQFYDPYDIDLEDMADKTEPFLIKEISAKMSFSSFKSITAKTRKLSKTAPSAIIDISPIEPVPSTSAVKDYPVHDTDNDATKIYFNQTTNTIKDGSSDSDESTKSDVPLKKYAEKKEKKLAELSVSRGKLCSDSSDSDENLLIKSRSRKKIDPSISITKKEENIVNDKTDNEKDRRSEQFMESFGFFSERKPRKSNLLATKKISETFHIIANDSDDVYSTSKEHGSKKAATDSRKEDKKHSKGSSSSASKRAAKRVRKKKSTTPIEARFCTTCEDALAKEVKNTVSKFEIKSDEDMDSITAKKILESDEVRNLENDLISNLKEASGLKGFANLRIKSSDELQENISEATAAAPNQSIDCFKELDISITTKPNRHVEVKDKMYPNIYDTIDMFEDKFDKIKRKCRSQAAAAKQIQIQADRTLSNKTKKKSDRRKVKKTSKKCQNVVPTKGALKGFDGIKVSILTSDINMSAIVPSVGNSFKKKKKSNSKKKRERKSSDVNKSDADVGPAQKNVDVYEFLDTEDTELFEFRPSTLMERFKSFNNKEQPSTSKTHANENTSTDSVSDGDDFVYMDDLAFSEDETENSMLSCELSISKGNYETKKSPLKRKDVIEKNAVMGKIFKHNAVRSDKKNTKQFAKPKANLDQLFDSLLEKEPKEQSNDEDCSKKETSAITYCRLSPPKATPLKHNDLPPVILSRKPEPSMSVTPFEELINQRNTAANKYEPSKEYSQSPQVLKFDTPFSKYRKIDATENDDHKTKYLDTLSTRDMDFTFTKHKSKEKLLAEKASSTRRKGDEEKEKPFRAESGEEEAYEAAGVARQRARRKCAVGKQNVLAETWSSESEPDGPAGADALAPHARRRRPRKRDAPRRPAPRAETRLEPRADTRWSDGEGEGQPPQHGWIVGDSHKKLVTMLAHAKGRKRSHDDKRRPLD